jgi:hypothetical protein
MRRSGRFTCRAALVDNARARDAADIVKAAKIKID